MKELGFVCGLWLCGGRCGVDGFCSLLDSDILSTVDGIVLVVFRALC